MHIVFLNRSYHPDPEGTGQYLTELAEDLAARGEDVSVVCGRSYHIRKSPGLLPWRAELRNGVRVMRVFNTCLPKASLAGRILNLVTYLLNCALAVLLQRRPDVVVTLTDPPLLPLLARLYARLAAARWVFAVNDVYPDIAVELGEISSPLLLRLLEAATSCGLRHSDRVVALGEDMAAKLRRKGCPAEKMTLIRYWADTELVRPRKEHNEFRRKQNVAPTDFVVMYSGNLGLSQRLQDVLEAAARLTRFNGLRFLIVGDGANKARLQHRASELGLADTVRFLPYQPRGRLSESLSAADLHLVPLAKGAAGSIVPCKVYGIMASGTPYLAVMDETGDAVRLARQYDCGLWCPPDSPDELRERIEYACRNREALAALGRNGRRAAEAQFARHMGVDQYHRLLVSLTQEGRLH